MCNLSLLMLYIWYFSNVFKCFSLFLFFYNGNLFYSRGQPWDLRFLGRRGAMKSTIFWDVSSCSLVEDYRRSERTYCLRLQGRNSTLTMFLRENLIRLISSIMNTLLSMLFMRGNYIHLEHNISPSQDLYLQGTTQTQKNHWHTIHAGTGRGSVGKSGICPLGYF
jgi:hypothetical protein